MECDFSDIEEGKSHNNLVPVLPIHNIAEHSIFHRCLAKVKLSKIINKYLIFEIFSFAGTRQFIINFPGNASKRMRSLIVENNLLLNKIEYQGDIFKVDEQYFLSILLN